MAGDRVNLAVATEDLIRIEKECDKKGQNRAQFIKEAIHEKLKNLNNDEQLSDIKLIKEHIVQVIERVEELRKIVLLLVERNRPSKISKQY